MLRGVGRALVIALEEFTPLLTGKGEITADTIQRALKRLADARIVQDVQKSAELDPTNPRAQAVAGFCELAASLGGVLVALKEADVDKEKVFRECVVRAQRIIERTVERLQGLTSHKDPHIAADAGYLAGVIVLTAEKTLYKDKVNPDNAARAEKWLRRSVELVPGNQSAWDWLCGALLEQEKTKELREVCEARLRVEDTPRNRCWAAMAYVELGQIDAAEQTLRAGLRLDAKNPLTHVSLAAVLLKRGDRDGVAEASQCLDRAEHLLFNCNEKGLAEEVALLRGVHAALNGNPAAARRMLHAVLDRNKEHPTATKLLQAIEH
jgi:hypothetical protein